MDAALVTSAECWQTATASISTATGSVPAEAWRMPLSRHLKLAAFVAGEGASSAIKQRASLGQKEDNPENRLGPLHVAASQGIIRLGSALLAVKSADPCVPDNAGRSPLHWAAMTDRGDFMKMLLDKGADVDARDDQNRTPLFSACAFGASTAARLLLQWGAGKDSCCKRGLTPLHGAAAGGYIDVVKILIQAGADPRKCTAIGANPRHVAERQGHVDVAKLLAERSKTEPSPANDGGFQGAASIFAKHKSDRNSLLNRPRSQVLL